MHYTLHVNPAAKDASDLNPGTESSPLLTLTGATRLAKAGTTVKVHPGIYRETLVPQCGGQEDAPIVFESVVPGAAIVRGSDLLPNPPREPGIHVIDLPSGLQGPENPYARKVAGSRIGGCHGQLFIGGQMIREVDSAESVRRSPATWAAQENGTKLIVNVPVPLANREWEISVRDRLFAPKDRGLGHIHVSGFVFEHCANPSAASFWESHNRQCGAVGFRAGHHFVFRNNVVRFAKTLGMDIGIEGGKESSADELFPHDHLIENNSITDNGECGICGLKNLRTVIRGNRVERNNMLSLFTVEEAGIKLHLFQDGLIENNLIRDNEAAGIWLDCVWTGTRVTRNVVVNNVSAGIFLELGDEGGTVDHNVVAYTRLGEGIYTHDSSDVLVAHNLLFGNAHFGIYMRVVTDRPYERQDGKPAVASCSRQRIVNNLFVDNYRGPICLPAHGPVSMDNQSEHNHFLSGTQWQWEGLGFNRFCLGDNDGAIPAADVLAQVAATGIDPKTYAANAYLDFESWQKLGYDQHSHAPGAFRITVQNGAVAKGSSTLSARDLFFELRLSDEAVSPLVPALPDIPADWNGTHREPLTAPGPFAKLGEGHHQIDLSVAGEAAVVNSIP